jgi:hypothetical protein
VAACEVAPVTVAAVPVPPDRPETPEADALPAVAVPGPSQASRELALYYAALQRDLLGRGLMRTDGGGPDTPYGPDDVAGNFEQIAFFDEYGENSGLFGTPSGQRGAEGRLGRWRVPVRVELEFGPSVPLERRAIDTPQVASYVTRLAQLTGHPISKTTRSANFHVFVSGLDDRAFLDARLAELAPQMAPDLRSAFLDPPRSIQCLVLAFSDARAPQEYARAIALIRAEHPDLSRLACIHEELAQGLGLANDSPKARPSIFNDDDEFALLTSQDELLLQMLYDPRLNPGMTAAQARPVTRIIARDLMGQAL